MEASDYDFVDETVDQDIVTFGCGF